MNQTKQLNPMQMEAVSAEGPLILAGAGSGRRGY